MYKEYFGFKSLPFSIAPDPGYLYLSEQHKEALAHLIYGVGEQGGFVLLSGEVGTGKTTICRAFLHQIPDHCELAYVVNPKQSETELLKSVCDEFGIYYFWEDQGSNYLVDLINEHLLSLHSQGKSAVLIIDEAQNLSADVLEQLRLLTNLETDEKKLLQLILLGQPELNELLARTELRQLAQRITARFHLNALTENETRDYVLHRLKTAGFHGLLFSEEALKRIFKASRGIPRLVNVICDRCLLGVYSTGGNLVNEEICQRAIEEVVGRAPTKRWRFPFGIAAASLALFIGVVMLVVQLSGSDTKNVAASDPASPTKLEPVAVDAVLEKNQHNTLLLKLARASGFVRSGSSSDTDCLTIAEQEYFCQQDRGDASKIMKLGTPVLALIEKNENLDLAGWVILRASPGERFTIEFPDGRVEQRSPATLANIWPVKYTWIWQEPKDYRNTVSLGESDQYVAWLREALNEAESSEQPSIDTDDGRITRVSYLASARSTTVDAMKPADPELLRRINRAKQLFEFGDPGLPPAFVQALRSKSLRVKAG
ncbi:MAG: ExeA family protein [Pseudomonadales bacterium]